MTQLERIYSIIEKDDGSNDNLQAIVLPEPYFSYLKAEIEVINKLISGTRQIKYDVNNLFIQNIRIYKSEEVHVVK
jgi:hypothetical protein